MNTFLALVFCFYPLAQEALAAVPAKNVLIVLNEGYRPEEYFTPRKIFEEAGFQVKVAGQYAGEIHPSRKHIQEVPPVKVGLLFDQVDVANFDAVVFVGGNGAWSDFLPNKTVQKILLDSMKRHNTTALICAATGLLATADNLDGSSPHFRGKNVTGYYEVEGLLKRVGEVNFKAGEKEKPFVVVDNNLITGRDPMSAALFGHTVKNSLLQKKEELSKASDLDTPTLF
jgi:protease I